MTITEAAKTVKRSRQTIYNYIEQGKLKTSHNGKGFEVELEDLLDAFEMSKDASNKTGNVSSDDVSNQASNKVPNELSNVDKYIDTLIEQLEEKDKQIQEKDRQIQELHTIIAMQQRSQDKLVEDNRLLLQDKRRKSWWQRLTSWGKREEGTTAA